MKVVMKTEELNDCRSHVEISVDGEVKVDCYDGEPEDNTLCRNFADIYSIPELMEMAYNAGFYDGGEGTQSRLPHFDVEIIEVPLDEDS